VDEQERSVLEAAIGYRFQQPGRLERSLTHSSHREVRDAGAGDNERLEFLGDAVLGLIVSEYLVARFPDWSEGKLSKSKGRLVSARSLQAAGQRLELGKHLRLGRGEDKSGGREKRTLLADAYEALIAAVYLDGGLEAALRFVRSSLLDPVVGQQAETLAAPDHKSALQEWLQRRGMRAAEYRVARESGPDHAKTFMVEVRWGGRTLAGSEGSSKKEAEQLAAERALSRLQAENPGN
jgi:ribonuclease-3